VLEHEVGKSISFRSLIEDMITFSDNGATELLISKVGGKVSVNAWLKENGYTHTELESESLLFSDLLGELNPRWQDLTPEESTALTLAMNGEWGAEEQYANLFSGDKASWISEAHELSQKPEVRMLWKAWIEDEKHWLGKISPREAGRLLESCENWASTNAADHDAMKATLLNQKLGLNRIPKYLDYPVAHKTGDVPPYIANDVGIVYAQSGPIVVSILTADSYGSPASIDESIAKITKTIVDGFDWMPN
jgi:beta-lactamase class A